MADTYGKLSEMILTAYYKDVPNDNSNYTLRFIAEQVAQLVASMAKNDAIEQSKLGEATFANDQFITTYFGLPLLSNVNSDKYIVMPNTPAGLPQGREIAYVGFSGNKKSQVFPMRNKDRFMQQLTPTPKWMILCYVENGNIVFDNIPGNITGPVDVKLVGSVPSGSNLLDLPLNLPKSSEDYIMDKVLIRLNQVRGVLVDNSNDNVSK